MTTTAVDGVRVKVASGRSLAAHRHGKGAGAGAGFKGALGALGALAKPAQQTAATAAGLKDPPVADKQPAAERPADAPAAQVQALLALAPAAWPVTGAPQAGESGPDLPDLPDVTDAPAAAAAGLVAGAARPGAAPRNAEAMGQAAPMPEGNSEAWSGPAAALPQAPGGGKARIIAAVEPMQLEQPVVDRLPVAEGPPGPVLAASGPAAPPPSPARQIAALVAPAAAPVPPEAEETVKVLRLTLQPEHLGAVEVTLKRRGAAIAIAIATSSAAAQQAIAHDHDSLRRALETAGLVLPEGALSVVVRPAADPASALPLHGGASFAAHHGGGTEARSGGQNSAARRADSGRGDGHDIPVAEDAGGTRRAGLYL
jgi:flagellar hook-length control protein FliK